MNNYDDILEKIKNNLKGVKDYKIRKKARWLIRVMESKKIRLGCDQIGLRTNWIASYWIAF